MCLGWNMAVQTKFLWLWKSGPYIAPAVGARHALPSYASVSKPPGQLISRCDHN